MQEQFGYRKQIEEAIEYGLKRFGSVGDIGRITPEEALIRGDLDRSYALRARGKIVGQVIEEMRLEEKRVLELGTGTGAFHRLVEAAGKSLTITYSDIDTERVRKHLGDRAPVLHLDLNSLNIPDNSQEAIVSLNLLDQFEPIAPPLSEIHRVLQPGGPLVILTDLLPDEYILYKRYADKILLPFFPYEDLTHSYYISMTREQAVVFGNKQPPLLKEFWFAYMDLQEPWKRAFTTRITADKEIQSLQHNFVFLRAQKELGFEPDVIDSIADSHRIAYEAMTGLGFTNVTVRLLDDTYTGQAQGQQKPGTEYLYGFDILTGHPDPALGQQVKEHAYMGVLTAVK
ncbi:MAG TPA: class I SAM-dependent methyltransferase [Patescibacteria group bacterium]|nr:class I SAM-dependent methyltransferase [Patescibacteria group bacterium]